MISSVSYTSAFRTSVFRYAGETSAWHFASVPKHIAVEIKERYKKKTRGWGSLPVEVTFEDSPTKTTWKASIFPDSTSGTYLLPIKAAVRKKEGVEHGDTISLILKIVV